MRCVFNVVRSIILGSCLLVSLGHASTAINHPIDLPPQQAIALAQASDAERNESYSRAMGYFYIATGAWVAILAASLLAILIMAQRISFAQRIRPCGTRSDLRQ